MWGAASGCWERSLRAPPSRILSAGPLGCQRFLAANRWIGNRRAVTTVMRGKLMATRQQAGQLVARRTDESVRRVADECERQVAELSARVAGPRGRVAVDR